MIKSVLKTIFILIVLAVVGYVAYSYFFKPSPSAPTTSTTSSISYATGVASTATSQSVGAQISDDTSFLSTLIGLNNISIDPTIFSSTAFTSLKDNTVQIVNDGTVGRANPFAPFDAATVADTTTSLPGIIPSAVLQDTTSSTTAGKSITIIPPTQ